MHVNSIYFGLKRPVSIYRASVGVPMGTLSILFMMFSSRLLIAASFLFLIINISPAYVMIVSMQVSTFVHIRVGF